MENDRPAHHDGVPSDQDEDAVVWVYAVTTDGGAEHLSGLTGVAGEPIRTVTAAGLSAVVGTVSDATRSGRPLAHLLVGLTAIESAGRAHHEVIAHLADHSPVLPLRLATVYPDDATIAALLAERRAELATLLESFRSTKHRPAPDPRFGADSGWVVLNGAYLLDAGRADELAEIVASVTDAHQALRAAVTGPWPPYSFADGQEL